MSMKKLKQQVATALVVAMTATNVLSAFAAETVIGKPSKDNKVTVTFNAGGGYWETASPSSAATFSNAMPEQDYDENKVATRSSITRTFNMGGKDFDAFIASDEGKGFFEGDDGYFVNLKYAWHWFAEFADEAADKPSQPSTLKNDNQGMKFAGWYDNSNNVPVQLGIETEIYNQAVLDAGWKSQQSLPATVDKAFDDLVVVGMPQDSKLVLNEVKAEDKKEHAALTEELVQINENVNPGETVYELVKDTPIVPIDIKIENFNSADLTGDKKFVTVVLPVPDDLKDVDKEAGERIIAIHFAEKDTYIIPVEVDPDTGNMSFALDLTQGFSPFFFVKATATKKDDENEKPPVNLVTVKVTGSDDGYIAAWTLDEKGKKYLPVDEEVKLDKGTELLFTAVPYGEDLNFKSYSITDTKDNTETFEDWGIIRREINTDCEISATFAPWEEGGEIGEDERPLYKYLINPSFLEKTGKYEGTVEVKKWNKTTRHYESFDGWKVEPNINDERYAWDLFDFDAEKNRLTSKESLELGWYRLSFKLLVKNEDGELEEEYFSRSISVGATITFAHAFYAFNDKVDADELLYNGFGESFIEDRMFAYNNGANWSEVEELLKKEPLDAEPRMYNYEFVGWQTLDGEKYKSDTRLVSPYESEIDFYAITRFEKDGKPYIGKEEGSNQGGNNNNNGGGSSSSGGGSRRHVVGGSSSTITSMTGTWTMGENGWKFLKTNGEYATNTWGYINNQWYYFNEAGDMVTGWMFINGRWYYLNPAEGSFQGAMLTGVIFDPFYNAYFYADANGAMVTGWYQVADKWYYFNPISDGRQGALFADTVIDGYYVGADGAWVPGN